MIQNKGLGKGLSALLGEQGSNTVVTQDNGHKPSEIAIKNISSWSKQPRQYFDEAELAELSESIRKNGVVQPIIVRKAGANKFEIIAGERRWRAAKLAGLEKIPAILMDVSDDKALEIALIENIQRKDLKALEMAESYQRLIDEHGYTQEQLSEVLGKSRSQVTNTLRLLNLPGKIKEMLNQEKLSAGHARALVGSNYAEIAAERIVKQDLSVRQTEQLIKKLEEGIAAKIPSHGKKSDEIVRLESELSEIIGFKVKVEDKDGKGKLVVNYNSLEELRVILERLKAKRFAA